MPVRPAPDPRACGKTSELEFWELFCSTDVLEVILRWANHTTESFMQKVDNLEEVQKGFHGCQLLQRKLWCGYLGFGYGRGLLNLQNMDEKKLFQSDLRHPIFRSTMSYNSHTFISAMRTFDDPTTRSARFGTDRFALINTCFDQWNSLHVSRSISCQWWKTPSNYWQNCLIITRTNQLSMDSTSEFLVVLLGPIFIGLYHTLANPAL